MNSIVKTIINGAIGLGALYLVGRVGYQVGHDVADLENKYEMALVNAYNANKDKTKVNDTDKAEESSANIDDEVHTVGKIGIMASAKRAFRKKVSPLGTLLKHPENHKIEAFMEDDGNVHIKIKPKNK